MTEQTPITDIVDEHNLQKLEQVIAEITHRKERAGIMATLIITILGIGIPIVLQPATKQYFHKIPVAFLLISFFLFYIILLKYGPSVDLKAIDQSGTRHYEVKSYKRTVFERIIYWRFLYPKQPRLVTLGWLIKRVDMRSLGLSQWGHTFFFWAYYGK